MAKICLMLSSCVCLFLHVVFVISLLPSKDVSAYSDLEYSTTRKENKQAELSFGIDAFFNQNSNAAHPKAAHRHDRRVYVGRGRGRGHDDDAGDGGAVIARSRTRQKRDIRDSQCNKVAKDIKDDLSSHKQYYQFNDTNFNLAMIWTGNDGKELMALTTMEFVYFASQSQLWISKDYGKSFASINHRIEGAIIRAVNGIFKSTIDPKKIILVSYMEDMSKTQTRLYVTSDGGKTFTKSILPFYLDGVVVFHPTDANKLLAHSPYQQFKVWVSDDFGLNWRDVHSNVMIYSWGTKDMEPGTLFVADSSDASSKNSVAPSYRLQISTDYGKSFQNIRDGVYSFGVQGKFVFAALSDDGGANKRQLYVSRDGGKQWHRTQLPGVTSDRFFSVLDMNEGMIFMHVEDEGNTDAGTLYTSDADGIVFSVSLKQHLFPAGTTMTDFYRVTSMRGVYMASQVAPDGTIHSMITFDRGGIWQTIKAPKGSKCKDSTLPCNLQIHNRFSKYKGVNAPSSPLSQPNAVGLVLAHGNIADALETHLPDVFVSNDGGYNWIKAISGPHHLAITNHGGLLLAIPAEQDATNIIKFSYDEGHCWNEYKFSEELLSITGLLPEPSAKSLNVSIWGFGPEDRSWRVITIDFSAVLKTTCTDQNFKEWVPHESNDKKGCLLGLKETFKRINPDSFCRLSYSHKSAPTKSEPCSCTKEDYECDYGFSRKDGSEDCEVSDGTDPSHLDVCINGKEEEIRTWGYRRIPGDKCIDGYEPIRSIKQLKQQCENAEDSNFSVEKLGEGGSKTAAIVMILLVVIAFSGGIIFLLHRHNKFPCHKSSLPSYRYSQLSDGDNIDKMIDLESHPTYHDSSDEEMLE